MGRGRVEAGREVEDPEEGVPTAHRPQAGLEDWVRAVPGGRPAGGACAGGMICRQWVSVRGEGVQLPGLGVSRGWMPVWDTQEAWQVCRAGIGPVGSSEPKATAWTVPPTKCTRTRQ